MRAEILLGKKKMHTLKKSVYCFTTGQDIVDVPVGELGKKSDICLSNPKINFDVFQLFLRQSL